jgi:hypothetical protein
VEVCNRWQLFIHAVSAAIMAYGFYKVGQSNRERRGIKADNLAARAALVPFLQVRRPPVALVLMMVSHPCVW